MREVQNNKQTNLVVVVVVVREKPARDIQFVSSNISKEI
jgi:hypothetical protein